MKEKSPSSAQLRQAKVGNSNGRHLYHLSPATCFLSDNQLQLSASSPKSPPNGSQPTNNQSLKGYPRDPCKTANVTNVPNLIGNTGKRVMENETNNNVDNAGCNSGFDR